MKPRVRTGVASSLVAAVLAALVSLVPANAFQAQWNYSFINNQATATYPGDVNVAGSTTLNNLNITGTCTGCTTVPTNVPQTWTATQTFSGSATTLATIIRSIAEPVTITAAAPTSTQNMDVLTGSVQYFTTSAANNWTWNIRGNGSTTLNSTMTTGQALTVVALTTQGVSPFFQTALTVDGNVVTPVWQGGVAPSAGNASGVDAYTVTLIKTGNAAFTAIESQVQFK